MQQRARIARRLAVSLVMLTLIAHVAGAEEGAPAADAEKDASAAEAVEGDAVVAEGRKVSIEYTLTIDDGQVADTNVGGEPLTYQQGAGQMLAALESELVGLAPGASKEFELSPEQGYGPVRPELFDTIDASMIPEEARSVGTQLVAQSEAGQRRPVRVHEVKEDKIVIDLNHPLAGKSLRFAVKVLGVE